MTLKYLILLTALAAAVVLAVYLSIIAASFSYYVARARGRDGAVVRFLSRVLPGFTRQIDEFRDTEPEDRLRRADQRVLRGVEKLRLAAVKSLGALGMLVLLAYFSMKCFD